MSFEKVYALNFAILPAKVSAPKVFDFVSESISQDWGRLSKTSYKSAFLILLFCFCYFLLFLFILVLLFSFIPCHFISFVSVSLAFFACSIWMTCRVSMLMIFFCSIYREARCLYFHAHWIWQISLLPTASCYPGWYCNCLLPSYCIDTRSNWLSEISENQGWKHQFEAWCEREKSNFRWP